MDGSEALPRSNGELVFEAPWQARIFGLAVALHESGGFPWGDFRGELIDAIARAPTASYYECWLEALTAVVLTKQLIGRAEMDARAFELRTGRRDDVH